MNLKYVKNTTQEAATMLLYQEIGKGYGIDGAAFAEEMLWLSSRFPLINIRINSPGGSVFEGYSIYSAMREVNVPVDTYNDFIAASMGGIIHQQGRKRYAADNSILMLHNPHGGGESKKDKEVLGLLKNSLVDAYVARTGKEASIISSLMDAETWIEARQVNGVSAMIEMGLADALFPSSVKQVPKNEAYNAKKLYSFSNNILTNTNKMAEQLEIKLTDSKEFLDKIEAIKNEVDALKKENEDLKKSIVEKDEKLKANSDKLAVELIDNAIKSGKLKAEGREKSIEDAKNSFDIVKSMIDAIPATEAKRFTNVIGSGSSNNTDQSKKDWTIRDYEEKDPEALKEIYNANPEKYNEMYNAYYKTK